MWRFSDIRLPVTIIFISTLLSGCGKFIYSTDLVNHGRHGIVVLSLGGHKPWELTPYYTKGADGKQHLNDPRVPGLEGVKLVALKYPKIPTQFRNPANSFGRLPGYQNTLPDEIEVVWQLADLNDCDTDIIPKAEKTVNWLIHNGYRPSEHVGKSGCTWHPLPDKVFRKTVDFREIKNSKIYKNPSNNERLNITFRFVEDKLTVIPETFTINHSK